MTYLGKGLAAADAAKSVRAWRAERDAPARLLAFRRWPDRTCEAGTAAKLRRRLTWRGTRPGDFRLADALDRIVLRLLGAGSRSW